MNNSTHSLERLTLLQQHQQAQNNHTNKQTTERVLLSFSQIQSESKVNITFNSYSQTLCQQNYISM